MPGVNSLKGIRQPKLAFPAAALLVIAADQLSKLWVRSNMALGESIPDSGFLRLIHVRNTGAAFGLFEDQTFALTIFGAVGAAAVLYIFFISDRFSPLAGLKGKLILSLILGGTIGNLIDRLSRNYVTDFIDIGIWPTFNIADSAVVIGIIALIFLIIVPTIRDQGSDG